MIIEIMKNCFSEHPILFGSILLFAIVAIAFFSIRAIVGDSL